MGKWEKQALCVLATVVSVLITSNAQQDTSSTTDCKIAFRATSHVLIGTAQGVVTAEDIDQCISLCMNSLQRFKFYCSSAVFYYDDEQHNCILNSENRRSRPDMYMVDHNDRVEYVEIECASHAILKRQVGATRNRNVLQMRTPEYGNWTMCDRQLLQHMRFKECQTLNPNKCQKNENECDPSKEDQYDKEGGSTTNPGGNTPPPPTPGPGPDTTSALIDSGSTSGPALETTAGTDTTTASAIDTISPALRQNRRGSPNNGTSGGNRFTESRKESKSGATVTGTGSGARPEQAIKPPAQSASGQKSPDHNGQKPANPGSGQKAGPGMTATPPGTGNNRGAGTPSPSAKEHKQIETFDGTVVKSVKTQKEKQETGAMHWEKTKDGFYRIQNETGRQRV